MHADTDLISSSSNNHDPEDEDHAEPDLPDDRGMRLDLVQQRGQKAPLTHGAGSEQQTHASFTRAHVVTTYYITPMHQISPNLYSRTPK